MQDVEILMRVVTTGAVALAAAGLLTATACAEQIGEFEIGEIEILGGVAEVTPGDGYALVRSHTTEMYVIHFVDNGEVDDKPSRDAEPQITAPAGLLPQSKPASGEGEIRAVWLSDATDRYRHGVLGDPLEASSLRVRLQDGTPLVLDAGADAVFEDLVPRLADLDGDGRDEIIVVKSYLNRGAALAVVGLGADGELVILAETPPIGRQHRWLNPIGAADFDGDEAVEIAYVETPHIGGRLMIWEWRDGGLVREHAEPGFSNHAIGSTELGLSAIVDIDGDGLMDLAVPGHRRDRLRLISLAGGIWLELADMDLGGAVATAIAPVGNALVFGLEDGRLIALRFGL